MLVIPVEATAGARSCTAGWTAVPQWGWALVDHRCCSTATNLFSVGNYGEFEFWFALVKVVAIVAFIAVGPAGHLRRAARLADLAG